MSTELLDIAESYNFRLCSFKICLAASENSLGVAREILRFSAMLDRDYLTPSEVDHLLSAAKKHGREQNRDRNYAMILLAYRHGLRVNELCNLKWIQVDWSTGRLHCSRLKGGVDSVQPLGTAELRILKRLKKEGDSPYIFLSERGTPISDRQFRTLLRELGVKALGFAIHPHQLRHACGYKLANDGLDTRLIQDYLGHANISSSVRYTKLSANRFEGIWKD